ncbi:ParA family protein [Halospeciosus flavus]|uniref:ParA family protein n=1 Tax=Halospeciosus flavus TaxID=3032283 RepID=A0ABD5Z1D7_9EURY|nr:ParA family protein [Halospeciosus flavus]
MTEPRAVSVALQKGGVGKTTIAINVAERLSSRGNDVLLVDLDQQGNATEGIGLEDAYTADDHIGDVLDDGDGVDVHDVIRETEWFDVVPAHENLRSVETSIRNATFGELRVRNEIVEPLLGAEYDYVVVDTAPKIGPLSDSSLIATGNVIVPMLPSEPSISGFERMVEQQLDPLRREIDLDVLAVVPNRLEGDNEEKRVMAAIEESDFGDRVPMFGRTDEYEHDYPPGPGIRKRIAFRRAWRDGVPLAEHAPQNDMVKRLDELAAIVEAGEIGVRTEDPFPEPDPYR